MLTRLAAEMVDKTLKEGDDGDKTFSVIVAVINKILLLAREKGLEAKFEVVELATRAWLVWHAYQKEHNPENLKKLKEIAFKLMVVAGEKPPEILKE